MIAKDLRRLSKLYIKILALELPPPHTEYMAEAILYLSTQDKKVTQNALENFLEVDKRSLMRMLQELVTLQYLNIEPNSLNRNTHLFWLTETGKALIPKIENAIKLANENLMGEMGKEDFDAFLLKIRILEANLKKRISDYHFKS